MVVLVQPFIRCMHIAYVHVQPLDRSIAEISHPGDQIFHALFIFSPHTTFETMPFTTIYNLQSSQLRKRERVKFAETLPIQLHQRRDLVYELTIRLVPSSRFVRPIFHLAILTRDGLAVSYRVRRENAHPSSEIVTYLAAIPGDVTTRTPLIYTSRRLAPSASVDALLLGVATIVVRNLIADSKKSFQLARKKLDIRNKSHYLYVHSLILEPTCTMSASSILNPTVPSMKKCCWAYRMAIVFPTSVRGSWTLRWTGKLLIPGVKILNPPDGLPR
jgi:hypothetical protein